MARIAIEYAAELQSTQKPCPCATCNQWIKAEQPKIRMKWNTGEWIGFHLKCQPKEHPENPDYVNAEIRTILEAWLTIGSDKEAINRSIQKAAAGTTPPTEEEKEKPAHGYLICAHCGKGNVLYARAPLDSETAK